MKTGFLIVGLTGPIGSGCTTISKFLSQGLSSYCSDAKSKLPEIEAMIGKYYRYLKKMQNETDISDQKYSDDRAKMLEPEQLIKIVEAYDQARSRNCETNRKLINRSLRGLILKRNILKVFTNTLWPNFKLVSMSTLIIKLVIELATDLEGNPTKEFEDYLNLPKGVRDKILELNRNHLSTMQDYARIMEEKDYAKLDYEKCRDIDKMYSDISLFKRDVYELSDIHEEWLQDLGDNLRGSGNPFKPYNGERFKNLEIIAYEANRFIKYWRRRPDKSRNHFVIDSFRNPEEVYFFRKRYGTFFLCSLYADKVIRKKRKQRFSDDREKRDQGKDNKPQDLHKQNVSGCVLISDYSINNDRELEYLYFKIARLLVLVDRPGWVTPTTEEVFMNTAYGLSLRSTCTSRQVGAVITNEDGFIIGAGWNDVGSGQLGCSTRCKVDYCKYSGNDSLLSMWDESFGKFKAAGLLDKYDDTDYLCFKDVYSELKIHEKVDKIVSKYLEKKGIDDEDGKIKFLEIAQEIKENLGIKRLEYARALHAEENAILQVATHGGMGIAGGTIYTTTFPCELCAKKIYQSGIRRIVYTEPYPDSISESIFLRDGVRHISFEQFEGVKSNSFFKLFKSPLDTKDMQRVNDLYYNAGDHI